MLWIPLRQAPPALVLVERGTTAHAGVWASMSDCLVAARRSIGDAFAGVQRS
jgi:hypothetical protein